MLFAMDTKKEILLVNYHDNTIYFCIYMSLVVPPVLLWKACLISDN
jgi:hypothetical protein